MSTYGGYTHRDYEAVEVFAERLQYAPKNAYEAELADYLQALNAITARRTEVEAPRLAAEKKRKELKKVSRAMRAATKMPRRRAPRKRKPYKRRTYAKAA
ncbi:hypothetical protein [Nocardia sp. CC227C]|uniref:hypothetical protein n=1 Tax=Nocardia sp. CC227C TaxID=3044562 RepID=UPI00278BD8F5|nr:hypothetical protein [Nocardia sp. CC227C]